MSVQDGLILKGERVVVPQSCRGELLRRIHSSHLGVNGYLSSARVFVLAWYDRKHQESRIYLGSLEGVRAQPDQGNTYES